MMKAAVDKELLKRIHIQHWILSLLLFLLEESLMPYALGTAELFVLVTIAIPVAVLFLRGNRRYRHGIAAFVCASLAAIVTPGDLLSMLILSVAFIAVFTFGSRYRLASASNAA